jgi:hypothetical protein
MSDDSDGDPQDPYRDDPVLEPWHLSAVDVQGGPSDTSSSDEDDEQTAPVILPQNCICQRCNFEETKAPFRCCGQESCLSLTESVPKLLDRQRYSWRIGMQPGRITTSFCLILFDM